MDRPRRALLREGIGNAGHEPLKLAVLLAADAIVEAIDVLSGEAVLDYQRSEERHRDLLDALAARR